MAFDDKTRRRLLKMVTACRSLLTGDFNEQLRSHYGIYAEEGRVRDLEKLTALDDTERETARLLRERIDHLAGGKGAEAISEAVGRILREQAFTVMNRFAAIRMAEERKIIKQSVGGGLQSNGFRVFEQAAGAGSAALGSQYERYLVYLDCLFDELSLDLGVLFDRSDALGLLFPTESAVRELFEELNHPDIAELWPEDETIGWIYQYWNSKEERKAMRDASAAPRNSRELAVRNQFFTPRYVVEFLTDNTLGRIWYEMTKGETRLKEQCRYLVRRPMEIFLPGPDTNFWHDAHGTDAFHKFSTTADLGQLPEDPVLGVLLGWVGSLKTLGFEDELRLIGLTHQEVMDVLFHPMERGETPEGLEAVHPIVLLQILWRLSYEADKHGYGDLRSTASSDPVAGPTWSILQKKLNAENQELGQDELLKLPVFIPHRPFKDPREIRLLDPACGSMHFGLYAFDLFEVIYEEAWAFGQVPANEFGVETPPFPHDSIQKKKVELVHSNDVHDEIDAGTARVVILKESDMGDGMFHTGPYLAPPERSFRPGIAKEIPFCEFDYQAALASGWITREEGERFVRETNAFDHDRCDPLSEEEAKENYLRQVPRLIIKHNIHGVDIDPRAVQIAGLSLWLRAQKCWSNIPVRDRPRVRRSNIVCAEPMPGSNAMLEDFVQTLDPPLLGEFVKTVFDKMQLAGEAGTLLKIEEEIRTAIHEAREEWKKLDSKSTELFSTEELNQVTDQPELSGLDAALRASSAELTGDFFDTAEERIYTALRNYAESAEAGDYQRRLFAEDAAQGFAFIDLCRKRYDAVVMNPPFGEVVKSKKGWLAPEYKELTSDLYCYFVARAFVFIESTGLVGAITSASFKTYVDYLSYRDLISKPGYIAAFCDLGWGVLDQAYVEACCYTLDRRGTSSTLSPYIDLREEDDKQSRLSGILESQKCVGAHWKRSSAFTALESSPIIYWWPERRLERFASLRKLGQVCEQIGKGAGPHAIFYRVRWEVPHGQLGLQNRWAPFSNGGTYSPFFRESPLVLEWKDSGALVKAYIGVKYPYLNGNTDWNIQLEGFYGRPGLTYGKKTTSFSAQYLFPGEIFSFEGMGIFLSDDADRDWILSYLNSSFTNWFLNTTCGLHKNPPYLRKLPIPDFSAEEQSTLANIAKNGFSAQSIGSQFDETSAFFLKSRNGTEPLAQSTNELIREIDLVVNTNLDIPEEDLRFSDGLGEVSGENENGEGEPKDVDLNTALISYVIGGALGRWDIRYATGERQPPELPDPFDPLPVCPPGMLQNADGLPAAPADV
ncbi:MAG: hypothetical protein P1U58_17540, partial [Verrucomicrobiales bacterium]|nr:hypothetical protein [Verrucomicrobiales bacterium]